MTVARILVLHLEFLLAVGQQGVCLGGELHPVVLGVEVTDIAQQLLRLVNQPHIPGGKGAGHPS